MPQDISLRDLEHLASTQDNTPLALLGRVWDGTLSLAVENGVLILQGERILAGGEAGSVAIPENARVVRVGRAPSCPA